MVEDENNFDAVRDAIDEGLTAGLSELWQDTLRTVLSNMAQGQDALGRQWKPVKPSTLRSRKVRTNDPSPLVDTGEFRADIQSSSEFESEDLIGIIGTTKVYGEVHEFGAPEAGIPRRPIFTPAALYAERRADDVVGDEIDTRLDNAEL